MNISFIVSNFNGAPIIEECLPTVIANMRPGDELIFADDCSTDHSLELVKKLCPDVVIVKTPHNMGFSANNNHAARQANNEWLFFLNNDMRMAPDCTDILREYVEKKPHVFSVSPCIYYANEPAKPNFAYSRTHWVHGWLKDVSTRDPAEIGEDPIESFTFCGGAFLCRKKEFFDYGAFNELYSPFYFEDTDLSMKALFAGQKILCIPQSKIYHYIHWSISKTGTKRDVKTIYERNRYLFHWVNFSFSYLLTRHHIPRLWIIFKSLLKFKKNKLVDFMSAVKAYRQYKKQPFLKKVTDLELERYYQK